MSNNIISSINCGCIVTRIYGDYTVEHVYSDGTILRIFLYKSIASCKCICPCMEIDQEPIPTCLAVTQPPLYLVTMDR